MQGEYQRIAGSWRSHLADGPPAPDRTPDGAEEHLWLRWCGVTQAVFARLIDRHRLQARLEQPHAGPPPQPARTILEPRRLARQPTSGANPQMRYGIADTPFGELALAFNARGSLCHGAFLGPDANLDSALAGWVSQPDAQWTEDNRYAEAWLAKWLLGDREAAVVSPAGTDFQLCVWRALLAIPTGDLRSYRQLAASIGRPRAARAVASAVASNGIAWIIPCHRVIRADGCIGGYRWGAQRKQLMIGREAARAPG